MSKREIASRVFRVLATGTLIVSYFILLERAPGMSIAYMLLSMAYLLEEDHEINFE